MKKWENAELVEISICETLYGGPVSDEFDKQWYDTDGALHVNYPS